MTFLLLLFAFLDCILILHAQPSFQSYLNSFGINLSPSQYSTRESIYNGNVLAAQNIHIQNPNFNVGGANKFFHLSNAEYQSQTGLQMSSSFFAAHVTNSLHRNLRNEEKKPSLFLKRNLYPTTKTTTTSTKATTKTTTTTKAAATTSSTNFTPLQNFNWVSNWNNLYPNAWPIRDQGQCGSCWTFSGTGVIEAFYKINVQDYSSPSSSPLLQLSEQEVVSCCSGTSCGVSSNSGCNGGFPTDALLWFQSNRAEMSPNPLVGSGNGISSLTNYPYISGVTKNNGACVLNITNTWDALSPAYTWNNIFPSGASSVTYVQYIQYLISAIKIGPVSLVIGGAGGLPFQTYTGGVLSSCGCEYGNKCALDHAVIAVGYGSLNGVNYIIVRNSWGTAWGSNGYINIQVSNIVDSNSNTCAQEECNIEMKSIKRVLPNPRKHWVGDGFHVKPLFADLAFTNDLSPFLMFDYAEPKYFPPTTKQLGVGEHPHRGFETVTIALEGEIEHGDSLGNTGVIGTGDIQWMTAAGGIIHQEFHSREFAKKGGNVEMMQLWVNLPSKFKMIPPQYQPILKNQIPVIKIDEGQVRVIAGDFEGNKGAATTFSPIDMWDVTLTLGKKRVFSVPVGHNVILFIRRGGINCNSTKALLHQVAILSLEGTSFELEGLEEDNNIFVLSGEPLNEPIAARGPMVMNTQKELQEAMADFYNGKFEYRK